MVYNVLFGRANIYGYFAHGYLTLSAVKVRLRDFFAALFGFSGLPATGNFERVLFMDVSPYGRRLTPLPYYVALYDCVCIMIVLATRAGALRLSAPLL